MSAPGDPGGPAPGAPLLLLTCEHADRRVPPEYRWVFRGQEALLESHRGWDPGAWHCARILAEHLRDWRADPLLGHPWTRLLADVNRSPTHPRVHGEVIRRRSEDERRAIRAAYHEPHRAEVRRRVERAVAGGRRVVHVGVHTFTPVLDGRVRPTDIGLLYDPAHPGERSLAAGWTRALRTALPGLRVHRNRPYRGSSDGLTTWLRGSRSPDHYRGLELEVNTRLLGAPGPGGEPRFPSTILDVLGRTLEAILDAERAGPSP